MEKNHVNVDEFLVPPFQPKEWGRLYEYDEFKRSTGKIDKEKIINYILLYYDLNSNLRTFYPVYAQRKGAALDLAGFKKSSSRYSEDVEDFIVGKNDIVNGMIIRYISMFGKPEYQELHAYYEMFMQESRSVFEQKVDRVKDTRANIKALSKDISELEIKLFGGKETTDMKAELYRQMDIKILPTPEKISKELSKGNDPLEGYDRYEGWNKNQKIRFKIPTG